MKNLKLYNEIKAEMRNVIEAEENAVAWKQEARNRMKDVNALITAAKKVNKDVEINAPDLIAAIREDLNNEIPQVSPAEDNGETIPEEPANETV